MRGTNVLRWVLAAAAVVVTSAASVPAKAQAPGEAPGAVTAVGSVTLKRTPDTVRVQISLSGEGKTLKEALAKLQQRRESAKKKLAALGATEASIVAEDPRMDA